MTNARGADAGRTSTSGLDLRSAIGWRSTEHEQPNDSPEREQLRQFGQQAATHTLAARPGRARQQLGTGGKAPATHWANRQLHSTTFNMAALSACLAKSVKFKARPRGSQRAPNKKPGWRFVAATLVRFCYRLAASGQTCLSFTNCRTASGFRQHRRPAIDLKPPSAIASPSLVTVRK